MSAAEPGTELEPERLPEAVRWVLLPLACGLLFAIFCVALFPYGRFREPAERRLAEASGARVEIGELAGGLGLAGPHVLARPVALRWPDGNALDLERARLRPAWSLSWLRGSPALHVQAEGPLGRAALTVWPESPLQVEGELRSLDVARLPLGALSRAVSLEGRLDAELAVTTGVGGPRGRVRFRAREGSLAAPRLPAIPFETLRGALARGEDGAVEVESLELEGPLIALSAKGRIGAAPQLATAPLDIQVRIDSVEPGLASALEPYGIRADGGGRLALRGTVAEPRVRSR